MQDFMTEIANQFGYVGIFFMITIENIFPPIPSEVILTFGGFLTTTTEMTIWGVILSATLGSVAGAMILYTIGHWFSADRMENWLEKGWGRRLRFKQGDVRRAVNWFSLKGTSTVFFCRCIPIVRSLISIPAGIAKMRIWKFILLTTAGSLIWNIVLIYFGAIAGESWKSVLHYLTTYSTLTVLILLILGIVFFIFFYKKRISKNR